MDVGTVLFGKEDDQYDWLQNHPVGPVLADLECDAYCLLLQLMGECHYPDANIQAIYRQCANMKAFRYEDMQAFTAALETTPSGFRPEDVYRVPRYLKIMKTYFRDCVAHAIGFRLVRKSTIQNPRYDEQEALEHAVQLITNNKKEVESNSLNSFERAEWICQRLGKHFQIPFLPPAYSIVHNAHDAILTLLHMGEDHKSPPDSCDDA